MTGTSEKGQLEAHTPAELAPSGRDPAPGAAEPERGAAEIDGGVLGGADPWSLVDGLDDVEAADVLALAAELIAAPRRARGRPAGAANRKNGDMIRYLQSKGHRDPWVTLSMMQTADTMRLAEMLGTPERDDDGRVVMQTDATGARRPVIIPADPLKVLAIQKGAAEALMPYHHAKKPQQLDLLGDDGARLPVMVMGDLNVQQVNMAEAMSLGVPLNEVLTIQGVSEGASVRQKPVSHDGEPSP